MNRIVFPADYFSAFKVDEMFTDQAEAFEAKSIKVSSVQIDPVQESMRFYPDLEHGETVFYRGWMLTAEEYSFLEREVEAQGAKLATSLEDYLLCHHIPNWYPLIKDLTTETVCFIDLSNLENDLLELNWNGYFVKDFVKSLKTSQGSILRSADEIQGLMAEMQKFRGHIEGGICVRKLEDFKDDSEKRYFVYKGHAFSNDGIIPDLVHECAKRIQSPFFSVDVVERENGEQIIVEVGDGQVSDLVGWDLENFVEIFSI